jgi:transcriptional regulator with XRE-family HTH domain
VSFSDRLYQQIKLRGVKPVAITRATGISRSSVSQWMSGISKPSGANLTKLCNFLQCDAEWIMYGRQHIDPDNALEKDSYAQDYNNFKGGSSEILGLRTDTLQGRLNEGDSRPFPFSFTQEMLRVFKVLPEHLEYWTMQGDSMVPVFPEGTVLGIDRSKVAVVDGKVYLIEHDGLARIKIVSSLPGSGFKLRSYNSVPYPDEEHTGSSAKKIRIIGRVFFYAAGLP